MTRHCAHQDAKKKKKKITEAEVIVTRDATKMSTEKWNIKKF